MGKSHGKHRSMSDDNDANNTRGEEYSAKRMSRNSTKQWEALIDDELEDSLLMLDDEFQMEYEEAS